MGNILDLCKVENNDKEITLKNEKNFNSNKFKNNNNIKTISTIFKSNEIKNIKEDEEYEGIMKEDFDNNTSYDFNIVSKVKNIYNNPEYNDIEENFNINNYNKYSNNFDEDKYFNNDSDEDIDEFGNHEIKNGKNEVNESFISLDLMNKDENVKYNLDIIWIDEKINNSENKNYLEKMKNNYPNITINVYDNLEEGFNKILNLEFVSIFVIVSGRLYS